MAFVDVALTVGTAVGLDGTAAVIGGGALIGAGAGAVGGGLYGAVTGKSVLNNALGGAGIGALVGAGAGYAMAPAAAAVDGATISSTALPSTLASESAPVTSTLTGAAPTTTADLTSSAIAPGQMNPLSSGMMNASTNSTSSLLSNLTPTGTSDLPAGTVFNNGTEMVGPNGSTYLTSDLQGVASQMGGSTAGQMGPTNAELGYTGPGTPSTNAAIQAANAASKSAQPWYQMFADHPYMTAFGGLTLAQMLKEQNKYGVPTTTSVNNNPPKNLNYAYNNATPMNLNRSYADGGSVNLNTSPIKQQLNGISTGGNDMFPQPGLHSNQYANPASTPVPGNVLSAPTDTPVDPYTGQQKMAAGGITQSNTYAAGGNLGGFSDGGRMLKGPGDGMSDDIPASIGHKQPARLADSEFVIPADVVSHLGNGSSDAGAKKLYQMMDKVRMARTGTKKQGKQIKADKYMPKFADGGQIPAIDAQLPNQPVVPTTSPALVLPSQTTAGNPATPTMTDQMAAYRSNMLNQYAPNDTTFLKQQYLNTLGRTPDQAGMDYWTKQLQNGTSPQDVANAIQNSPEAAHVSSIRQAMGQPGSTGQTSMNQSQAMNYLTSAYNGVLGRAPDAGGLQYFTQQITSGAMTPQQVQQALMNSPEYLAKQNNSAPAATGGLGATIRKRKK